MAKQRRVFEIAKELGVKSKAIVEKCQDEGIPNITNHMSSISVGLEATIREWFSGDAEDAPHTAVETGKKVDLEKVKAKPRKRAASKATAKPAAKKATASGGDDQSAEDEGGVATLTEEAPVEEQKVVTQAPPASEKTPPPSQPTQVPAARTVAAPRTPEAPVAPSSDEPPLDD
ncbi:MAG: translation initiation factor IF-2 N-terminal domain-containing protein, partial [Planctomycetota bacterium]